MAAFLAALNLDTPLIQTPIPLPLLRPRPRLTLINRNRMQHDLIGRLRRIDGVPFTPVVADGISEYGAIAVEAGCGDGAADGRVALEAMLSVFVPEVEGAVGAGGAEGAVHRVERDGVDRVHVRRMGAVGRGFPVAAEGEVGAVGVGGDWVLVWVSSERVEVGFGVG